MDPMQMSFCSSLTRINSIFMDYSMPILKLNTSVPQPTCKQGSTASRNTPGAEPLGPGGRRPAGGSPGLSALVKKSGAEPPSNFELVRAAPLLFEPEHFREGA